MLAGSYDVTHGLLFVCLSVYLFVIFLRNRFLDFSDVLHKTRSQSCNYDNTAIGTS